MILIKPFISSICNALLISLAVLITEPVLGFVGEKRGAAYALYTDSYLYGSLSALIDFESGDELTPFKYVTIQDFHDGYALAIKEDRISNGYIDINGAVITEFIYDQNSGYFINGLAPVCHNDKWGIINTDGDYVLAPKYDSLSLWHRFDGDPEVKYITATVNDKFALIDRNAKEVIPPIYNSLDVFSGDYAIAGVGDYNNRKYGILKIPGAELIVPCIYGYIYLLSDSLAAVSTKPPGATDKFSAMDIASGKNSYSTVVRLYSRNV